jgi:hypothetical protein
VVEKDRSEIGVVDVWIAVKRRPFSVLGIVIACAILAVGYSLYTRSVEDAIVVEIGAFGGTRIEEAVEVVGRLRGAYLLEKRARSGVHISSVENVAGSVILITGAGPDPDSVADFLERIVAQQVEKHADMAGKSRQVLIESQLTLRKQIEMLRAVVAERPSGLTIEGAPLSLLGLQPKPYTQLFGAEKRLEEVESQLTDPKNRLTSVLRKPARAPLHLPIALVALALFAGIIVGLVIATAGAVALEIGKSVGTAKSRPSARA